MAATIGNWRNRQESYFPATVSESSFLLFVVLAVIFDGNDDRSRIGPEANKAGGRLAVKLE